MQYLEFLRMAGVTDHEVTRLEYRAIEQQYMTRDDLFPSKETVVAHFHRFGWRGFTNRFVEHLDALRTSLLAVNASFPREFEDMLDVALTLSGKSH